MSSRQNIRATECPVTPVLNGATEAVSGTEECGEACSRTGESEGPTRRQITTPGRGAGGIGGGVAATAGGRGRSSQGRRAKWLHQAGRNPLPTLGNKGTAGGSSDRPDRPAKALSRPGATAGTFRSIGRPRRQEEDGGSDHAAVLLAQNTDRRPAEAPEKRSKAHAASKMSKPTSAAKFGNQKPAGERKRRHKVKHSGKEETEATRKKKAAPQASKPARRTVLDRRERVAGHQAGSTSLPGLCTVSALYCPNRP